MSSINGYLIAATAVAFVLIHNWQRGNLRMPSFMLERLLADPTAVAVVLGFGLFVVLVVVVLIRCSRRVSDTDYVRLFDELAKAQGEMSDFDRQNRRVDTTSADGRRAADSDVADDEVEEVVVVPDASVPEAERLCAAFAKHGLRFRVTQRYIDNGFHGRYNSNYGMGTRMQISVHPADFASAQQLSVRLLGG